MIKKGYVSDKPEKAALNPHEGYLIMYWNTGRAELSRPALQHRCIIHL